MSKAKLIISGVLFVLLAGASIFGIVKLTSIETKNISPFLFSVGALDETDGTYIENDTAIVTKNVIECQGLSIVPKFDSTVDYRVFFYNEDEAFINCSRLYSMYDKFDMAVPKLAKYCRIVIYPSQFNLDGSPIQDFKVKFYEPVMYASNLTIKVDKKQQFTVVDLIDECVITEKAVALNGPDTIIRFATINTANGTTFVEAMDVGLKKSSEVTKVNCSGVKEYKFIVDDYTSSMNFIVYFFDDTQIVSGPLTKSYTIGQEVYFDVPSYAKYLVICHENRLGSDTVGLRTSLYQTK